MPIRPARGNAWPTDANRQPEPAAAVQRYSLRKDFLQAQMTLESFGIPTLDGTQNAAGITYLGNYLLENTLSVPQSLYTDACALLGLEPANTEPTNKEETEL